MEQHTGNPDAEADKDSSANEASAKQQPEQQLESSHNQKASARKEASPCSPPSKAVVLGISGAKAPHPQSTASNMASVGEELSRAVLGATHLKETSVQALLSAVPGLSCLRCALAVVY